MDARSRMREYKKVQMTHTADIGMALRAHLRSHNGGVLAASGVAVVFSAVGWAVLYGVSYWMTMIALTVFRNGDAGRPAEFNTVFFGTAAVLLLAARVDQYFFPSERAVDGRPPMEHLADLLFFVPRFTMSCWQNLGALARLTDAELPDAVRLLDELRTGGRVSLQELPAQFPDGRTLQRLLNALTRSGLIEYYREKEMTLLRFGALAPVTFRSGPPRVPTPDDPLAEMPQVKIRTRTLDPEEDVESGE